MGREGQASAANAGNAVCANSKTPPIAAVRILNIMASSVMVDERIVTQTLIRDS
jgi:hypothetical protein